MGIPTLNNIFYKPDIGASGAVEKGKFDDGLDVADGLIEGNKPVNNKLSAFAPTTSAELAGVLSDRTGNGKVVFGTSPVFLTGISTPKITGMTSDFLNWGESQQGVLKCNESISLAQNEYKAIALAKLGNRLNCGILFVMAYEVADKTIFTQKIYAFMAKSAAFTATEIGSNIGGGGSGFTLTSSYGGILTATNNNPNNVIISIQFMGFGSQ